MNTYIPLPNSSAGSPVQFSEPAAYSYESCHCCPRNCQINRTKKQGWCHSPAGIRAARAALHPWEEPCISGLHGSGTIFFSGCTLRCAFCQNGVISQENFGKEVSSQELRAAFERLIDEGCQNINLVTPTHFLPSILPALAPKLPVPVVYNCGGYESVETLRALEGLVDIYLPDFKYSDAALAKKLSAAPDYPQIASAAILEMYHQVGGAVIEDEQMTRGVIIRHLVLPGLTGDSMKILTRICDEFPGIPVSLMGQYTPCGRALSMPGMDRKIKKKEYARVLAHMEAIGLDGYRQELGSADGAFIPSFDETGV